MNAKKNYLTEIKRKKIVVFSSLLLLTLSVTILQATILPYPAYHNGWIVSTNDQFQYSIAYDDSYTSNSFIGSFIDVYNLTKTTTKIKVILDTPIVHSDNLTIIVTNVLHFIGTVNYSVETNQGYKNVSKILLPVALPVVDWVSLVKRFKQYEDSGFNITISYSFFARQLNLSFTSTSSNTTTVFNFIWNTDFGILEQFYCTIYTYNSTEHLFLEEIKHTLNYKNEIKGIFFLALDYSFFAIPFVLNIFLLLTLFSQIDFGEKYFKRYFKIRDSEKYSLKKYTALFLFFNFLSLVYGYILNPLFSEIPEYRYISMFGIQFIVPTLFGLILTTFEITLLKTLKEKAIITVMYPCYGYITGMALNELLNSCYSCEETLKLALIPLFFLIVICYHLLNLRKTHAL